MQTNAKQYPEVEFTILHILYPRYRQKIVGHIPKNKKKEKVCLYS